MRAWCVVIGLLVGCGGNDDGTDLPDTDTDDPGGSPEERCDGIPTYDIVGMSCAQLGTAYENLLDDADRCTIDTNCQVIRAPCEHWNQVGCWYTANDCIVSNDSPTDPSEFPTLNEFGTESQGCATTQVCDCNGPTPTAVCEDGRCELKFETTY